MDQLGCTTGMFRGDLAEKLQAMREAGFSHTEFMSRDLFESLRGPEYALSLLKDTGMRISCFQLLRDYEGAPRSEIPQRLGVIEQMLDQVQLVGADLLILCSNTAPDSIGELDVLCDDIHRLGELAASRGVRIGYEALGWGRWMSDYRSAWKMIQRVDHPNIGMMLDSSHIGSLGLPMGDIRSIDPAKIFLAEIADLPITRLDNAEQSRFYRLLPGEGMLALEEFVQVLEEIGYQGVYSLEVFNDHYRQLEPRQVARRAHQSLVDLLARSRSKTSVPLA
jgi:4-hydroxyphenylpyruvate dioxygenase